MSRTKDTYRHLCKLESSIPIFSRDWWLDTVCGDDNWDVVLAKHGDVIVGAMPFFIRNRLGRVFLTQPPLTQTLGPWIRPSAVNYPKLLSYQKDVMESLIDQLPRFDHFSQKWHYSVTNWLPFYWHGFHQTTLYTYVLDNISDENMLWKGLQSKIRTDIRKASTRFGLEIRSDLGVTELLALVGLTYLRQERVLPLEKDLVTRIDEACMKYKCRKIYIAEDSQGRHHAGVYMIWDENSAYYLIGGGDPELRNSGATSLCLWEAIRYAATVTKQFDFEGSMVEPIERFFRAFGAVQMPYFCVYRAGSLVGRTYQFFRAIHNR